MLKVLVVGCGSIGKKHIKNLLTIEEIEKILVYTNTRHLLDEFKNNTRVQLVKSLENVNVNFAIIANETYKHLETAIFLAEKGVNLFIEKPLSHNLEKVDILKELIKGKRLKVFVGYNLRFLSAIRYIKDQLFKKSIGDLYFAKIEAGQYLPYWRSNIDYRKSYSANKEKGGGVSLDLSHEIDYMRYLFGDPSSWKIIKTKVSKLEIDSEDIFEGLFKYENGFVCNVHTDYLQGDKKREIRIVGSKGVLICDFIKKNIRVIKDNSEININHEGMFDIDKTYIDELIHFIKSIKEDIEPDITLDDGIKTLSLLEDKNV